MKSVKTSVIVPAFNEARYLPDLIDSLLKLKESAAGNLEIVVVDDGSTDNTPQILGSYPPNEIAHFRLDLNKGKGHAVRFGISKSHGDFLLVQDADGEYDPLDIPSLLDSGIKNGRQVVFGSRNLGAKRLTGLYGALRYWPKQSMASWCFNFILSLFVFFIYRKWITDALTGYKLYPRELFANWTSSTDGFETDHEITAMLLRNKIPIIEVPIHYAPRSRKAGKKIRAIDAWVAIKTFWRFRK